MTEPTTAEVLEAAREKIADPAHWTQVHSARNAFDRYVSFNSELACKWCAVGAVALAAIQLDGSESDACDTLDSCAVDMGFDDGAEGSPAVSLNDSTDHPTVLRMFDCAIAKASA